MVRWLSCAWLVECRGSSCWYHLRFYAGSLWINPDVSSKARIRNKNGNYQRFEWRESFQRCLWKQQSFHTESHEDKRFPEWWICDAHRHGGRCAYDTKQDFTSASQERVWSLWREGLGDFFFLYNTNKTSWKSTSTECQKRYIFSESLPSSKHGNSWSLESPSNRTFIRLLPTHPIELTTDFISAALWGIGQGR